MERLKERVAHIGQYAVTLLKWMVLGGVIGLVGGIIGSLFHIGVDTATQMRLAHPWVLYLMPVGGLASWGCTGSPKRRGRVPTTSSPPSTSESRCRGCWCR